MGDYGSSVLGSPKASDDLSFTEGMSLGGVTGFFWKMCQARQ